MTATILNIEEIVSDPKVRSGRPVIAGTGLRVSDIVAYHLYGDKLTPEQIAEDFRLSLGQIHAALAYYYLHQAEIDEQMQHDAEEANRLIAELEKQGKADSNADELGADILQEYIELQRSRYGNSLANKSVSGNFEPNLFTGTLIYYAVLDKQLRLPLDTSKRLLKSVALSQGLGVKSETASTIRFEYKSDQDKTLTEQSEFQRGEERA